MNGGPSRPGAPAYPARRTYPGRLIAVEGIDGCGKSTQIRLLLQWLLAAGQPAYLTTWNSSALVHDALRSAKRDRTLTPAVFSLMHAADLADRLEREVVPRLRAGHIVLADRWVCTAFARDGARGLPDRWLRTVYAFAPRPAVAVYFRVPVEEAASRIFAARPKLKYYEAGLDLGLAQEAAASFDLFQRRVADRYESLVRRERLHVLDACEPVAVQQQRFRSLVRDVLPSWRAGPDLEDAGAPEGRPAGQGAHPSPGGAGRGSGRGKVSAATRRARGGPALEWRADGRDPGSAPAEPGHGNGAAGRG